MWHSVKFRWILFSSFRGEVKMSQPIRGWGGHLSCPVGPKKYKPGRGRWDLASYQVSLNSVQQVQRRSQKCEKLVHLIVLCVVKEGTATSPIVFWMDWIVAFWDYFQPIARFFSNFICVKLFFFCHESPDIWIRRVWYMLNYQIRTCKSIIYIKWQIQNISDYNTIVRHSSGALQSESGEYDLTWDEHTNWDEQVRPRFDHQEFSINTTWDCINCMWFKSFSL